MFEVHHPHLLEYTADRSRRFLKCHLRVMAAGYLPEKEQEEPRLSGKVSSTTPAR